MLLALRQEHDKNTISMSAGQDEGARRAAQLQLDQMLERKRAYAMLTPEEKLDHYIRHGR